MNYNKKIDDVKFFFDIFWSEFMVTLLTVLNVDCYYVAYVVRHIPNRPTQ